MKHQISKNCAFTLAEVLIALALLGVIAAFAIPKVLQATQNSKQKAAMQEVYASLSEIIQAGILSGEITPSTLGTYVRSHLNTVKSCTEGQAVTDGCWIATASEPGWLPQVSGFVFQNGAYVLGFGNNTNCASCNMAGGQWATDFIIDVNGAEGPNMNAQDRIYFTTAYGTQTYFNGWVTVKPGQIVPQNSTHLSHFQQLMQ